MAQTNITQPIEDARRDLERAIKNRYYRELVDSAVKDLKEMCEKELRPKVEALTVEYVQSITDKHADPQIIVRWKEGYHGRTSSVAPRTVTGWTAPNITPEVGVLSCLLSNRRDSLF